jgi:hypothetical protein
MQSLSVVQSGQYVKSVSQKQRIELALRDLCEQVKKPETSDGYIHLRMRAILGGSRYSYLLLPLQKLGGSLVEIFDATQLMSHRLKLEQDPEPRDPKVNHDRLVKFVYSSWLIVNGLRVSK